MRIEKDMNGGFRLHVAPDEAKKLAAAIIQHAEDMPTVALDLQSLLKQALYALRDDFRQPPGAFEGPMRVPSA